MEEAWDWICPEELLFVHGPRSSTEARDPTPVLGPRWTRDLQRGSECGSGKDSCGSDTPASSLASGGFRMQVSRVGERSVELSVPGSQTEETQLCEGTPRKQAVCPCPFMSECVRDEGSRARTRSPVPTVGPASMGQRPLSVCPTCWEGPASRGFYVSTWTPTPASHEGWQLRPGGPQPGAGMCQRLDVA